MYRLTLIMTIATALGPPAAHADDFFVSNNPQVTITTEFESRVWLEFLGKEIKSSQNSETTIYNANHDFEKAKELLPKIQLTQ